MERHGKPHMAQIGARGFETTVNRHFGGDKAEYLRYLHGRANELGVNGFVEKLMQERLDKGDQITSVELPVFSDSDHDPFF